MVVGGPANAHSRRPRSGVPKWAGPGPDAKKPGDKTMMQSRWFWLLSSVLLLSVAFASAQAPGKSYTPLKTPWGDPDLQGTFTNATITPFERPVEFAGKEFLTEKEAAELERRAAANRVDVPPREGDTGTYNQFWFDRGSSRIDTKDFTGNRSSG